MKIGLLFGSDSSLEFENNMVGFALTWWKRYYSPSWHFGCRFTIMFGGRIKYGLRISTYNRPMFSSGITRPKQVIKPTFQ
jgi:hypothetical protein